MKQRLFAVEFKIDGIWMQSKPLGDIDLFYRAEKILHEAGVKARVVAITTETEIL